jgi:hypothetical protein
VAEECSYSLSLPDHAVLWRLEHVLLDGVAPRVYTLAPGDTGITLVNAPRADQVLEVRVVVIPDTTGDTAPDWLLARYGDDLAAGVLARLFAMTHRPWSNPNAAAYQQARYSQGVAEARAERTTQRSSGNVRLTIPKFI